MVTIPGKKPGSRQIEECDQCDLNARSSLHLMSKGMNQHSIRHSIAREKK